MRGARALPCMQPQGRCRRPSSLLLLLPLPQPVLLLRPPHRNWIGHSQPKRKSGGMGALPGCSVPGEAPADDQMLLPLLMLSLHPLLLHPLLLLCAA